MATMSTDILRRYWEGSRRAGRDDEAERRHQDYMNEIARLMQDRRIFADDVNFLTGLGTMTSTKVAEPVAPVMPPKPEAISNDQGLERIYLEIWEDVRPGRGFTNPGRQILHCTFGSVLTDPEWGPLVKGCVADHRETYREVLADHFERHLKALRY